MLEVYVARIWMGKTSMLARLMKDDKVRGWGEVEGAKACFSSGGGYEDDRS